MKSVQVEARNMRHLSFKDRILSLFVHIALSLLLSLPWFAQPDLARGGAYLNSAHGNSTTGVNRGFADATFNSFQTGLCLHCHEQHGSIDGNEPAPTGGQGGCLVFQAYTTNFYDDVCVKCHAAGGQAGAPNINTEVLKANNHSYNGTHTVPSGKETLNNISSSKHVYCVDCHSPHFAGRTKHTKKTSGNAIASTSPLYKVTGAKYANDPTWPAMPASWTTPLGQSNFSLVSTATKEYQICFKCHSGANTNVASWGGAAAAAWTDVGLEFNPSNKSGHPVVTGLNNYANSSAPKALATNQMKAPWNVDVGTQTMYCTDCHDTDAVSPLGPHGSAVKWMLAGANKAWPYEGYANNGTSSGTYRDIGSMNTNQGTSNGLFCLNCHSLSGNIHSSMISEKSDHEVACVMCHIRVPHGGKSGRLQADFGSTPMPARYYPNGNGGGYTTGMIAIKKVSGSYSDKDYCAANCGEHSSSITGGEHW